MDIVKRAYLQAMWEVEDDQDTRAFHKAVRDEIIRLIRARAYRPRDWPLELGPLPEELRAKRGVKDD